MVRAALLLILVSGLNVASAQQAAPVAPHGDWQKVEALAPATSLRLQTGTGHVSCKMKAADADTLSCSNGQDFNLKRPDVLSVKVPHRGRSALVGLAIGAGVGAIIGASACHGVFTGICAIGAGIEVGAVGAGVGALTDFTRSTVYRAP